MRCPDCGHGWADQPDDPILAGYQRIIDDLRSQQARMERLTTATLDDDRDTIRAMADEARAYLASQERPQPLSDRGALEQACIAVTGPWFDESHEEGRFAPIELAQRILREYDQRRSQERPAFSVLRLAEAIDDHNLFMGGLEDHGDGVGCSPDCAGDLYARLTRESQP